MTKTPNDVDAMAGARLKLQRQMCNMSQTDLGNKLGITFQQIQKYENGKNRISASRLKQLSQILGVSVSYFFGEEAASDHTPAFVDSEVMGYLNTSDALALTRAFLRIEDQGLRSTILNFISELADHSGKQD